MKKLLAVLFISALVFTGCEGDQGPPGPEGPAGEDGINILGQTYEYEDVTFDYYPDNNIHGIVLEVPEEIEVLESDAILVYRLEFTQDNDGQDIGTWSMLPQNFFLEDGTIQYVFNHTEVDVEILIDGNFDLEDLSGDFTTDQIFRFVVVPSDFAEDYNVDVSNLKEVMNTLDLKENDIQHIQ